MINCFPISYDNYIMNLDLFWLFECWNIEDNRAATYLSSRIGAGILSGWSTLSASIFFYPPPSQLYSTTLSHCPLTFQYNNPSVEPPRLGQTHKKSVNSNKTYHIVRVPCFGLLTNHSHSPSEAIPTHPHYAQAAPTFYNHSSIQHYICTSLLQYNVKQRSANTDRVQRS
ncbi:hypothetical protein FVEG_15556 [Fusarium verticillioides 7600]|uniref:Uncharacterized protein n=1 Tax=Gibberella moniliformis (strain M3125 / FGSC 7600) TaxID=334819 RepID=W7M6X9_GIBM7|nr:hypothetical protein FVEG_15556 [Fusarium verticillioides 7600]EWG43315.1 hypothetical protein FVEG_15556 [Fusarium verticillioides 7600]